MSYDFLFQKANRYYVEGALEQAEQLCRIILETAPDNPDVLNMLGLIAQAKGFPNEAIDCFYKALKTTTDKLPLYFSLAVSLASSGRLHEAVAAYQKVLTIKPDLKEAHNNLGGLYERLDRPQEALAEYQTALDIDENYLEAAVNIASLNQDKNKLQQLAQNNPNTSLPLYYLARLEAKDQNTKGALEHIKEAVVKADAAAEVFLLAGEIFLQAGNKTAAADAFRHTLSFNPKSVPALINLGVYENDEKLLKEALDIEPDNAEAHADYANLLYKQKRTLEALEEYRKAVVLRPDLPELSNNLGLILKDIGEYEQALDLFLDAFMKNRKIKEFSINLAETLVLWHQKNPEQATKIADDWARVAPDNSFAVHTSNAFHGISVPENDIKYAEELFDAFAPSYEKTMKDIKYAALNKIKELNISFRGNVLDLGCGTGLAGKNFHNAQNTFTGVDISQNMINLAYTTASYDKLIKQDIITYLQQNNLKYDIILLIDVLDYVYDFESVVKNANKASLVFTIENAAAEIVSLSPTASGRYQHNPAYIEKILLNAGYTSIKKYPLVLRQENGEDIAGTLFFTE